MWSQLLRGLKWEDHQAQELETNLKNRKLGLVTHAYNHNTQEAEAGELLQIQGLSGGVGRT